YSRWQLGLNLSQAFFNSLLSCKVFAKLSGTFTPFFVSIRSDICFFTMTANGPAALRSFDRALLEGEILQDRVMYEVRAATECIRRSKPPERCDARSAADCVTSLKYTQ